MDVWLAYRSQETVVVVDPNVKLHDSVTASRSGKDEEEAKYFLGQKVELLEDIVNDGTYPHAKIGTLMMPKGSVGYIKDIGEFLQVIRVYEVHFFGTEMEVDIIGCREHELKLIEDGYVSEDILEQEAMDAHRKKMAKLNK
ncbi:nitrogen fixation protein NifZ [Candidatus Sulfurimonas baltica]|uniref:nitrogen fixation protein NifZ n=1 Tax=Candidatus Sulfurimonas baltica TaxID=2740404 RepID=UPI001E459479|nr:nitrogen fixation protein NifZ [Candidatus Sulfurimonas baltica]